MTEALRFAAVVDTMPLLKADAVVVLSGDGEGRLDFAVALMAGHREPMSLVLSGGVDNPPFSLTAHDLARKAIERGVHRDLLALEADSKNTRDQAVNVVALAKARGWGRLLLVASPFHAWRAYLSFVHALNEAGLNESIHIVNATASQLPWFKEYTNMKPRIDQLDEELEKIARYQEAGHVASWEAGLEYLRYWEGR